jgi:hypothetical protein
LNAIYCITIDQVIVLESHGSSLKMRLSAAGEEQLPELFATLSKEPMEPMGTMGREEVLG